MTASAWTGPARDLAAGVRSALAAVHAHDGEALDEALDLLARVDPVALGTVLGELTRDLLERAFPDGLDADDAGQVLREVHLAAHGWQAPLETDTLVIALSGALGVALAEEQPHVAVVVVHHGLLMLGHLSGLTGEPLTGALDRALGELQRAQTMELP